MDPDPAGYSTFFVAAPLVLGLVLAPVALSVQVAGLLFLLAALALFSGSEAALLWLNRSESGMLAEAGDRASARVTSILEHLGPLLVTLRMMSGIVTVCIAALSALLFSGIADTLGWSPTWPLLSGLVVLTTGLVVITALAARFLASRHAVPFSRRASASLLALHRVLAPLSNHLARGGGQSRPLPVQRQANEGGDAARQEPQEEPDFDDRDLLDSIAEFGETTVREIMVSRLDVVALPSAATMPEALKLIRDSGHSRIPLYVDHLDNILGIVYAKDILHYLLPQSGGIIPQRVDWKQIARPPMFVPQGKQLSDLLKDFQTRKMHLAVVVDEYGGTAGLVTLEDVLEEIVGDIRDEHDNGETALYECVSPGTYRFDARIDLDDLNDVLGTDLDTDSFDFETLGGLIFHLTGSIPEPGAEVSFEPLHMRVESVDSHRIGSVVVQTCREEPEEIPEETPAGER